MTETYDGLIAVIDELAARYPAEYWRECDWEQRYPQEWVSEAVARGLTAVSIPRAYGGLELGCLGSARMLQRIAETPAGLAGAQSIHAAFINTFPIIKHGSPAQKEILRRVATGETRFHTFSLTEPHSGFDTTSIRTFAERRGDHYVVNGSKFWTSRYRTSDWMLLVVRTRLLEEVEKKTLGISMLMVELTDEARAAISETPLRRNVRKMIDSYRLEIRDLKVPVENLVGSEDRGFYQLLDALNPERIWVGSEAIGLGKQAIRMAVERASERVVFGRPVGQNQGIAFPLADAYAKLVAAEAVRDRAAEAYDRGEQPGELANATKYLGAEFGFEACDKAVDAFGGVGVAVDWDIERHYRDVRMLKPTPVSQHMILNYLSEHVLGLPRSY